MFRPDSNRDRTDYSGILMPPDGYRLDRAVGTTYSLDLEALTAVAICLGLSEETDSKLMQNPIGMLNALQKVSDKIVLFCEAGQIKVPTKPTALSILLEKMVVEVALPKDRQLGRYPSFHPKTWVLAYVNADGDKKYRFVVMSRNLTFDRSWDISFAMDSSKNVRQKKKTQPICDFLDYLVMNVHNTSNNAGKKRNLIRGLCADIKDVSFSLDSKIFGEDFEVLPLGIGKNAYRMQEDILFCKERGNANSTFNELVVMSPFLSESVIADFNLTDRALSDCKRTLVTRRSELGKLKASDVDNFTIYALKDEIIDGEEEISDELADKKKQDIHAKIYLRRKYSDVDLYLGSMNASYSAINKNVEMMLWLGTKNMYLNGDKFLEDIFCGPVGDAKNPFEQVTVADAVLETESDNRNLLEQKIKDLCRVKRQAVISEDNENAGKYKIEVEFSGIESDSEVTVSPFNSKQEQTLSEHIETICNDPQVCRIVDLPVYYELKTNNGNRDYRIQIGGHYMNYNTVYVGMDVHKESFTLCSCKYEDEKASHYQRTPASYKNVLRYLAFLRTIYGEDTRFVCGYEAGCLGYSLYHQLENFNVECVILAPTTMLEQRSKRRIKTDKRDAEIIARSLAQHNYSPVHIPTETDNQTKEFIRMRDDHKAELKKIKQQILSFCLRQGYQYDGSGNWTAKHVKWLRSLKPAGLYKEILDEYLLTYTILTDKLNRLDQRIEELASKEEYTESVSKLTCFLGIKTHTALSVIVEVGDFQRFVSARKFAGYLGLVPGQHSSGDDRNGLGITKAGNTHVRRLLVESAQSYTRGKIGYKSRVLRSRQAGNSPQVINYADRANERLRRRYYKMVLKDGKKYNIAKTAIARELACFIWGMMTDNIY